MRAVVYIQYIPVAHIFSALSRTCWHTDRGLIWYIMSALSMDCHFLNEDMYMFCFCSSRGACGVSWQWHRMIWRTWSNLCGVVRHHLYHISMAWLGSQGYLLVGLLLWGKYPGLHSSVCDKAPHNILTMCLATYNLSLGNVDCTVRWDILQLLSILASYNILWHCYISFDIVRLLTSWIYFICCIHIITTGGWVFWCTSLVSFFFLEDFCPGRRPLCPVVLACG